MKCESCNETISNTMRAAIGQNFCPTCGGTIMNEHKAAQYYNLLNCLDQTKFTNKDAVDAQIREKVATLVS